jgi:hypothetical protein
MKALLVVPLCALALAGCATITRGTTDQITLNSEPPDANVRTSIGHVCVTPCILTIDRKTEFIATFSKPGYADAQIPVATRIASNGAVGFAGNLILGGIVGMAADAATGATLEHFPNPVNATLVPLALPSAQRPLRARRRPGPGM